MKVLLVGGGGREHALAWRIAASPTCSGLWFTHENPGFPGLGTIVRAETPPEIAAVARRLGVDLVVVGPEAPLVAGVADALAAIGVPCFGPTAAAARIEGSKSFAKEVLAAAGVPTAPALVVDARDPEQLRRAEERAHAGQVVLKADGLAAGKGVIVCPTADEALMALRTLRADFGDAAERLVLEDLISGPEVSLFALCDGARAVPLCSAQDHKRLRDGDQGPNTGGMGAYAPYPGVDAAQAEALCAAIHQPVLDELARRGAPFRGLLYAGLMLTDDGPSVLEFNARFGDPETQALMALWDGDLLPWLWGAATGQLPAGRPRFVDGAAVCVVVAAPGYPEAPRKGAVIPEGANPIDGVVFHAGTRRDDAGALRVNGGRVLGVTARGADLAEARARAYAATATWRFEGAEVRADIGAKGISPPRTPGSR